MARKKYLLDNKSSKELIIRWNGGWRETNILWNDEALVTFEKTELLNGCKIELPDGQTLDLKLEKGIFTTLVSKIGNKHIPNSQGDPKYQLRQIFYLLIFIGLFNIVLGAIFFLADLDIAELPGIGIINIIIGTIEILLGYAISKGSLISLIAAVVLLSTDLVLAAASFMESGLKTSIFMKVFFLLYIIRGFKYIKELKSEKM